MCGRTSLSIDATDLENRFDIEIDDQDVPKRYNIAPRDDLLAVRNDEPETCAMLNWGLVPSWADGPDAVQRPINARAETVRERSFFRPTYENRRCLILADGFYEWKDDRGTKQPYRFQRTDGDPFAFAGLWESWTDGSEELRTCTILTTEASPIMQPVHDRMPVILEPDEEDAWLSEGNGAVLEDVIDPYPEEELEAYEISPRVNDPTNDDPGVIEPADTTQSGLGDFST